jgi:hypothetical protein
LRKVSEMLLRGARDGYVPGHGGMPSMIPPHHREGLLGPCAAPYARPFELPLPDNEIRNRPGVLRGQVRNAYGIRSCGPPRTGARAPVGGILSWFRWFSWSKHKRSSSLIE